MDYSGNGNGSSGAGASTANGNGSAPSPVSRETWAPAPASRSPVRNEDRYAERPPAQSPGEDVRGRDRDPHDPRDRDPRDPRERDPRDRSRDPRDRSRDPRDRSRDPREREERPPYGGPDGPGFEPRRDGPAQAPMRPPTAPRVDPNNVLGVFGLSIRTRERDLEDEFGRYGEVDKVVIVYDQRTDRSRGFGFITMHETNGAAKCIENLNGMVLHGRAIRVDYSATNKAHAPTPGEYRGEKRPFDDRFYRGNDRYRAGERGDRGDRYEDRRGGAFDRGDRWSGDRGGDRADRGGGSWRDRDGPGGPPRRDDDPYGGRSRRDDDRGDRGGNADRRRSPSPQRRRFSQSPERRPPPPMAGAADREREPRGL